MLGLRRFGFTWWGVILSKCQMKLSARLYFIPEVGVEWERVFSGNVQHADECSVSCLSALLFFSVFFTMSNSNLPFWMLERKLQKSDSRTVKFGLLPLFLHISCRETLILPHRFCILMRRNVCFPAGFFLFSCDVVLSFLK